MARIVPVVAVKATLLIKPDDKHDGMNTPKASPADPQTRRSEWQRVGPS